MKRARKRRESSRVEQEDEGQLIEEEVQVVGEEANPVGVPLQEVGLGVVVLLVEAFRQVEIEAAICLAKGGIAVLNEGLDKISLLKGKGVDVGKEDGGVLTQVLVVEVVELQSVEGDHEVG